MRPFLITGLPRTRTAWMAAYFSSLAGVMCFHEPSRRFESIDDWRKLFVLNYEYIGVSDSGMGFFISWFLENTDGNVLIIDRDLKECEVSLVQIGVPDSNYCEVLQFELDKYRQDPRVLSIQFDRINDSEIMSIAVDHLLDDLESSRFDKTKFEEFCGLVVECDKNELFEMAYKHGDRLLSLMKDFVPLFKLRQAGE